MATTHFKGPLVIGPAGTSATVSGNGLQIVSGNVQIDSGNLKIGSSTLTEAEIAVTDGVTPGTVTASKAVVVDANKDITTFRHVTLSGNLVTGSTTLSEAELAVLDGVTAGTAAASKAVVPGSGIVVQRLNITQLQTSVAAKTAGTTQTQAGATAITSTITAGTTGNANDGYLLPAVLAGDIFIIHNLSANAGKVYANGTETLNGTAGNAGSTALTASKTMLIFATANGASISGVMM
jgi:hypothetical protein